MSAAFTGWQGYEAHQARRDAIRVADQARKDAMGASNKQLEDVRAAKKAAEESAKAAEDLAKGMERATCCRNGTRFALDGNQLFALPADVIRLAGQPIAMRNQHLIHRVSAQRLFANVQADRLLT